MLVYSSVKNAKGVGLIDDHGNIFDATIGIISVIQMNTNEYK